MSTHTRTQRPLVSDVNSETWRLALTIRAAQELREAALYSPRTPLPPAYTGPYYRSSPSLSPLGDRPFRLHDFS
jgi:hypothetical protein